MVNAALPPFFRCQLLFRRTILMLRAMRHVNLTILKSLFYVFFHYSLHKAFRSLDKNTNPYGETPFFTLDKIARNFGVLSKDIVYDLGSGRGIALLWWATQVGCTTYGVDNYLPFIQLAKRVKERFSIINAYFLEEDFLKVDLSRATVIYLYGTALPDAMIYQLITRFKQLGTSVKIITVSYPLSDYDSDFTIIKEFRGLFPWGQTDIYLNRYLV